MIETKTIGEIFNSLTDKQKHYVYSKVGQVIEGFLSASAAMNYILRRPDFTNEQKEVVISILKEASKGERNE